MDLIIKKVAKKVKYLPYLPEARSFSEIEAKYNKEDNIKFDVSDKGQTSENMYQELYSNDMFLFILSNLHSDMEIIVFLLQIVREEYKKFTYDELANSLGIHRVRYMQELRKTKDSIKDILVNYK